MKYYIVLDTETAGGIANPIPYDIGYAVIDEDGNVMVSRSYVIYEVFESDLMETAYYKNKMPQYCKDLKDKTRHEVCMNTVKRQLYKDCAKYNIDTVIAHHAIFDKRATHNGTVMLTKYKEFLPSYCHFQCSQKMAHNTICKTQDYIDFCQTNGYMTRHKKPRVRETAEVLYRYLSGDNNFIESHTGLEDVMIEKDIFVACAKLLQ